MVRPRRCIWGGDRQTGIEGSALWSQGLQATSVSSWAPMWDHYGRKDKKQFLSVYDALGIFGKDWNRRESEEEALLDGRKD